MLTRCLRIWFLESCRSLATAGEHCPNLHGGTGTSYGQRIHAGWTPSHYGNVTLGIGYVCCLIHALWPCFCRLPSWRRRAVSLSRRRQTCTSSMMGPARSRHAIGWNRGVRMKWTRRWKRACRRPFSLRAGVFAEHGFRGYVRVIGTIRTFHGHRHISANLVRVIEDPMEAFFHFNEVMAVTMFYKRGPVRSFFSLSFSFLFPGPRQSTYILLILPFSFSVRLFFPTARWRYFFCCRGGGSFL